MTKKQKFELKKIVAALVLYILILLVTHVILSPPFSRWYVQFFLFIIPYLIVGFDVLKEAAHGIRSRQMLDEAFLMTLATFGAFAAGEYSEGVAVMLFFQVGEFFQDYAVNRSRASIRELMDIAPDFACVLQADGTTATVDPDEVQIGDILLVKPGEKIPIDGTVIDGESRLNTSALTGESVPRTVRKGSEVISGCINGDQLLKIRADKAYEDSTVARILELVENASEKKSKTENFITRFARYYTPVVVGGAGLLAVLPPLFFGEWLKWLLRACIFLVISCPCALVISVPLAFFGGIGAASKQGILVKGSNYLELLAKINVLVTDKTGTLTKGNFRLVDITIPDAASSVSKEELLRLCASAEQGSSHPIANSIIEAFSQLDSGRPLYPVSSIQNVPGQGILVQLTGAPFEEIRIGNRDFMEKNRILPAAALHPDSINAALTQVYVSAAGRLLGILSIRDEVKEDSKTALHQLKQSGISRIVMTTGDRKEVADAVAAELQIDEIYSGLLPQNKVEVVEQLIEKLPSGQYLAAIGDGINDAPVLSRADIGIAMGSLGSDAAIEAADVVIMDDRLSRLHTVVRTAKKTHRIATENIVFALGVKLLILALGALGFAGMWAAVFADVGVATLCILNSMRLLRISHI